MPSMMSKSPTPPPEATKPRARNRMTRNTSVKLAVETMNVTKPPYLRNAVKRPTAMPMSMANTRCTSGDMGLMPRCHYCHGNHPLRQIRDERTHDPARIFRPQCAVPVGIALLQTDQITDAAHEEQGRALAPGRPCNCTGLPIHSR